TRKPFLYLVVCFICLFIQHVFQFLILFFSLIGSTDFGVDGFN
ncbi:unnamed protein product, partial [Brassica napus]